MTGVRSLLPGPAVAVGVATCALSALATAIVIREPRAPVLLLVLIVGAGGLLALRHALDVVDPVSPLAYGGLLVLYYAIGIWNPSNLSTQRLVFDARTTLGLVLLVLVGIVAYAAGALVAGRGTGLSIPREFPSLARGGGAIRLALGLFVVGAAFAVPCYLRDGVPILAEHPDLARTAFFRDLSPYVFHQWIFLELALVFACVALWRRESKGLALAVLAATVLLLTGLGSRVLIGTPIVIAAVVYHMAHRRLTVLRALGVAAISLLIIGGLWLVRVNPQLQTHGAAQGVLARGESGGAAGALHFARSLELFARTSVETFAYFVKYPQPAWKGEVMFMSILAVLPGKQDDIGLYRVTSVVGSDPRLAGGTTLSLIGGAFVDFKTPGVIVLMFLLGLLLSLLYRGVRGRPTVFAAGIYAIVLSYYVNMIYGGQWLDTSLLWRLNLWVTACTFDRALRRESVGALAGTQLFGTAMILLVALVKNVPLDLSGP